MGTPIKIEEKLRMKRGKRTKDKSLLMAQVILIWKVREIICREAQKEFRGDKLIMKISIPKNSL